MDEQTRYGLLQLLGDAMSAISEEAYCASWLPRTASIIHELCRRAVEEQRPQIWGNAELTPPRAKAMIFIAEQIGAWANLNGAGPGYVEFQPYPLSPDIEQAVEQEIVWESQRKHKH